MADRPELTDKVKSAITDSGLMNILKRVVGSNTLSAQALTEKAQAAIDDIQQRINSGTLDDASFQKLGIMLRRLQGVLQKGSASPEALAAIIAEAKSAIGDVDSTSKSEMLNQQIAGAWRKIEQYNKEIDDDFEKMRRAGIAFDERLWSKHKSLSAYLDEHPKDIEQQKALDAVDDQLLHQAEPQLKQCPGAKPHFDDAKKKSEDRQKEVAEINAVIKAQKEQRSALTNADWGDVQTEDVSMNEVTPPIIRKQKPEVATASGPAK